jgi:hypothetical protein
MLPDFDLGGTVKIKLQSRPVYGKVRNFPMCTMSALLVKLVGKKCLNKKHIEILKSMGFEIEFIPWQFRAQ